MNIMNRITLKGLKKNKTRTIVTIIGVILSTAMITAVTSFASSLQLFLINYTTYGIGNWHIRINTRTIDEYQDIIEDNQIKKYSVVKDGGYAPLVGSKNEYKPYLYIMELDNKAFDTLPIHITQGRLPKNSKEVLLSEHILYNGGVEFKLGQEISLEVGARYSDGYKLDQQNSFHHIDTGETEEFIASGTRSFTVVGFFERFPTEIENFAAPGYSILTCLDDSSLTSLEDSDLYIYINFKNPRKAFNYIDNYQDHDYHIDSINYDILQLEGSSDISGFNAVIYGLSGIIMTIIIIGSVALIYNSFSISVSERRKQFGLLSSVGATRKQLMNSVFFESLFIAVIGIPLGICSGILGIGITLHQLRDNFIIMLGERIPVELTLNVSVPSVIAAVIFSLITILISAYIPARRTKKISAIDAVRQTADIKLTYKKVKTSKLTRKIFGIEGDLALKNLKRNKKRYRSTVFSLFISVLLFITASSFSMYLTDSVENVYDKYNYDFRYAVSGTTDISEEYLVAYENIRNLDGIYDSSIIKKIYGTAYLKKEQLEAFYYSDMIENGSINDGDDIPLHVDIYKVDHETFINYIEKLGLKKDKFQNTEEITAIAIDRQHYYDDKEERFKNTKLLKVKPDTHITIDLNNDDGDTISTSIVLGAYADTVPIGIPEYSYGYSITLLIDEDILKDFDWFHMFYMFFSAKKPFDVEHQIVKILNDAGLDSGNLYNIAEDVEYERNIILIIKVFAYGFIILMSLISVTNVFNTITTNINLRRREFAMLKSVGITGKGFNKMLNYECIFYGLKALIYGIPTSIFITYLIYLSIDEGVETSFYMPAHSILISILSIFLVVFISMMYSMKKIRKENILDALKNENL